MRTKSAKHLIDLQLDDAPLIMKKTAFNDKCGSCNQSIPNKLFLSQNNFNTCDNLTSASIKNKQAKTRNNNSIAINTDNDDKTLKTTMYSI